MASNTRAGTQMILTFDGFNTGAIISAPAAADVVQG
jgi:hypothetical protein